MLRAIRFTAIAFVTTIACSDSSEDGGNQATETGTGTATTTGGDESDTGVGRDGLLGCPSGEVCTFVLVSQTLDDRVEIFSPFDPDGSVYRGTIDVDVKPNVDGTIGGGLLDEPFGLAVAGGHLHVLLGHYPRRDRGSLVSFPLSFIEMYSAGETIPVDHYYDGGFRDNVSAVELGEEEPIFMLPYGERLLVSVFNNDLFMPETSWTNPGKLLVIDPSDPSRVGTRELGALEGGSCDGAAQIVSLGAGRVAIACDGNDAVAFLDVSTVQGGDPAVAAATITGNVCPLPVASERRVRHLASDGAGVIVAVGPGGLSAIGAADLHRVDANTCFRGVTPIAANGQAQLGHIVAASPTTWLLASGAGQLPAGGMRGIYVVRDVGGSLEVCEAPIGGFDEHWQTPGLPVDPFALALTPDGSNLAVGVTSINPESPDGVFGKVLWASLSMSDDPCAATAQVVDLTSGDLATVGDRVETWRRAPNVVEIAVVQGR